MNWFRLVRLVRGNVNALLLQRVWRMVRVIFVFVYDERRPDIHRIAQKAPNTQFSPPKQFTPEA